MYVYMHVYMRMITQKKNGKIALPFENDVYTCTCLCMCMYINTKDNKITLT